MQGPNNPNIQGASLTIARWRTCALIGAILTTLTLGHCQVSRAEGCDALPEFTQSSPDAWLNSKPLKRKDLLGNVLLLDVWTFACWNCYRSFPWLRATESKFDRRGLRVVGIHSPEFAHEKKRANVAKHIQKYQLVHPVMMDNDFAYWKSLNNRYWPAFYVVDRKGCIRGTFIGETHSGTKKAREIESAIEHLL